MSYLCVYHASNRQRPERLLNHAEDIARELAALGVEFAQWPLAVRLDGQESDAQVLAAFAPELARVQQDSGLALADVWRLDEQDAQRETLRQRYLQAHVQSEDEVRMLVAGRLQVFLQAGEQVYALLCEKGDVLRVPAGLPRWLEVGEHPCFTCIRLCASPAGRELQWTGTHMAGCYPGFED